MNRYIIIISSIRTCIIINNFLSIMINSFHLSTTKSHHCSIDITSEDMCEMQQLLITDKQPAIRIDYQPCKVKPNHTTYEHPEGLVWQPFTSSFTDLPRRTPTHGFWSYLLTPGCEST